MHRNDGVDFEPDANGAGRDGFREGDPGQEPPVNASEVNAKILNTMQEELARSVEILGETLDENDNEQLGTILGNLAYGTAALPTTPTRTILLTTAQSMGSTSNAPALEWEEVQTGPGPLPGYAISKSAIAYRTWCLTGIVPSGATITKIRALVQPSANHGSPDAMSLAATRYAVSGTTVSAPFSVGPYYDNGSSGADQWIDSGTIALFAIAGTVIEVRVKSSIEAADDTVLLLEVTFTDPGPRNF